MRTAGIVKILKFILKIIPTAVVAFFAFIAIGEGISNFIWSWESFVLGGIIALEIVAVILVWVKEKIASWFLIGTGVLMMIFVFVTASRNQLIVGAILGLPLLIPGLILALIKDNQVKKA
jgi:hypothetical protein